MWEQVFRPSTGEEAVELLDQYHGSARVIAGGTDLILQLRNREIKTHYLIDINSIKEFRGIQESECTIFIGAATTHAEISSSRLIKKDLPVLAQACSEIGSPQIRNTGTLGGNVVNAQPAADAALALVALGAEAHIRTVAGDSWIPVADLYLGPGESRVSSEHALLTQFRIPRLPTNSASAYRRLGKCKSVALPVICAACVIGLSEDHKQFEYVSLAIGPVAPWPLKLQNSELDVEGKPVKPETINNIADIACKAAHPRDSLLRCSADFREEMVAVLTKDVIQRAVYTLQNPGE
jgi:CO/xanthine dehydrogenase FAD-binding subunit